MLPGYNEGRLGVAGNPLDFVFLGTQDSLVRTLKAAGWQEIPGYFRGSLADGFGQWLAGQAVTAFPPPPAYRLLGRRPTLNFSRVETPRSQKQTLQIWRTGLTDPSGRTFWWSNLTMGSGTNLSFERNQIFRGLAQSPNIETAALLPSQQIPLEGINDQGQRYTTDGRVALIVLKRLRRSL